MGLGTDNTSLIGISTLDPLSMKESFSFNGKSDEAFVG